MEEPSERIAPRPGSTAQRSEAGLSALPGGCIVEGRHLETRYQWKTTVGDLTDRRLIVNRWNTEFRHRPAPDYYQSFGLGFYEYFLLSEDIGAEPLPIVNCGMACQFNSSELAPLDDLDHYIQDALDLIEFANGSAATAWGASAPRWDIRPFNLKMIGVGNEQWGRSTSNATTLRQGDQSEAPEDHAHHQRRAVRGRRAVSLSVGRDAPPEGRHSG